MSHTNSDLSTVLKTCRVGLGAFTWAYIFFFIFPNQKECDPFRSGRVNFFLLGLLCNHNFSYFLKRTWMFLEVFHKALKT